MPTRLILIRHGLTDWNQKKRYCGFMDITLSKRGKEQAKKLQKKLKAENIDRVYVSDRKRAIQTAKIIFKNKNIEEVSDLREMHFGIFEGLTYKEILEEHPGIYRRWLRNPFSIDIPKAENIKGFKKRTIEAIKKIIFVNKNKTIAVVSHGGTISVFINHILKSKDFWKQIPEAASISIIEFNNHRARIKSLNDTTHL